MGAKSSSWGLLREGARCRWSLCPRGAHTEPSQSRDRQGLPTSLRSSWAQSQACSDFLIIPTAFWFYMYVILN